MKKRPNIPHSKYVGLYLYDIDIERRYRINDEDIIFVDKYEYYLIGNPKHQDITSNDHEYFLIHYGLFDRTLEMDQNHYISLKVISKYVSLPSINNSSTYSISKLSKRSEIVSRCHKLHRKRQKEFHGDTKKSIDDLNFIVVNTPPKIIDQEKFIIATSFLTINQDQSIEN